MRTQSLLTATLCSVAVAPAFAAAPGTPAASAPTAWALGVQEEGEVDAREGYLAQNDYFVDIKAVYMTRDSSGSKGLSSSSLGVGGVATDSGDFDFGHEFGADVRFGMAIFDGAYNLEAGFLGVLGHEESIDIAPAADTTTVIFGADAAPGFGSSGLGGGVLTASFDYESDLYGADLGLVLFSGEFDVADRPVAWDVLGGARWIHLDEDLSIASADGLGNTGSYGIETQNDLFGGQIGVRGSWQLTDRIALTGSLAGGLYANISDQSQAYASSAPEANSASEDEVSLALSADAMLGLSVKVTERGMLTAGYRVSLLDGVASAPSQIDSRDPSAGATTGWGSDVDADDTVLYHGFYAGLRFEF